MKACPKCGLLLPLEKFALRKRGGHVRQSQCRQCQRGIMRQWSKTDRARKATESFYRRHPQARVEYKERYVARYPIKARCHLVFSKARELGKVIPKPCETCGSPDVHGHHDDYLKPLTVRWLCSAHHAEWHRLNGEGKNGGASCATGSARIGVAE